MSDFAYNLNLQPTTQEDRDRCMKLIARQASSIKAVESTIKTGRLLLSVILQTEPGSN